MVYKNNLGFTEAVKIIFRFMTICEFFIGSYLFSIFRANFKILTVNFKI